MKGVNFDRCVQYRERGDSAWIRGRQLETYVHHEMEPVDAEGFDRGGCEAAKAGPGVVEGRGPLSESEPGQVEGDPAETAYGQLDNELAIQKRRRRHTVQAHHRLTVAPVEDKGSDTPTSSR